MPPDDPYASPPPAGLSRRQVMTWSALAAAAPLGLVGRGTTAVAGESPDATYQRVFLETLTADPDLRRHDLTGREFLYRPRQLLVARPDVSRVMSRLRSYGHPVTEGVGFGGVARLRFAAETDIPALVTRLRDPQQWPGQPVPLVQPHHVLVGFGNIMGNPGGPPRVAAALPAPDPARAGEGAGVTVGICDTGIWRQAGSRHPLWLGGSYLAEVDDEDAVYVGADVLALQGGHGTFVAGLVRQAAPGVRLDPEAALNATGVGDEEMLVAALGRLGPQVSVVNLSLGYFTQDDQPPLPLVNALAALPGRAVVASAGNAGTSRRAWPAALERVLAVGAVSAGSTGPVPASYSNHGEWVDACALGDRTSTYVRGRLELPGQPTRHFDGFAAWAGTSFATGHVAGRLAALMTGAGLGAEAAQAALVASPRWHPDYGVLVA
ncbi:S8/S53 family peptidase [Micromonospora sp. CPCC 205546]|uniref:S8 family peptidase n=1 Tax=Micromonospora sp. CPCC 205546 TaxID=3122397 RepID=UPI002FF2917E